MARKPATRKKATATVANDAGPQSKGLIANINQITRERINFLASALHAHMTPKHNHSSDFGYPDTVEFGFLHRMYKRNGLARGAITKTVEKTWENVPQFLESPADEKETKLEKAMAEALKRLRFWQHVAETDRRSMVGRYSALILRVGDNKKFNEPIEGKVPGGLDGLIEVIPAWEDQLRVTDFESDQTSPNYGHPKMFQFNEANVEGNTKKTRSFDVHPDRVILWSKSGTVHDDSDLEPGYNALIDCEKIAGAGGEGFWKMAKAAPVLEFDKDANIREMAKTMGVTESELYDKIGEHVEDYNTGLDKSLLVQGINVKPLPISMPSPEHAFAVALQVFCASMSMPMKILIGMQTGERASTEDQTEWAKTIMSRREMRTMPLLNEFLNRLKMMGMISDVDWEINWVSLLEDSPDEQITRSGKMAEINAKGTSVFTDDEIREVAGYEALTPAQRADLEPEEDDYFDQPEPDEDEE